MNISLWMNIQKKILWNRVHSTAADDDGRNGGLFFILLSSVGFFTSFISIWPLCWKDIKTNYCFPVFYEKCRKMIIFILHFSGKWMNREFSLCRKFYSWIVILNNKPYFEKGWNVRTSQLWLFKHYSGELLVSWIFKVIFKI